MTVVGSAVTGVRSLRPDDLDEVRRLLDRDRLTNVFVRYRVDSTGLDYRLMGGGMWGWYESGALRSLFHAGTNLVPIGVDERSAAAFAAKALADGGRPASLVGRCDQVELVWPHLEAHLGPPRSPRWDQPFLAIEAEPLIPGDPRVRRVTVGELDVLHPACVSMFTEEVGVAPGSDGGYRARVAQLIANGWAFAIMDQNSVLFKAEVAAVGAGVCQIQGVWVAPPFRGRGLAAPALASVVAEAQRSIAPIVTLYVNAHNTVARRLYERIGFHHVSSFASVLL